MAKENREHKDSVFTDLFYSDQSAKKNLLSLYNALFDTNLTDVSVIEKMRLENVLFMNQKNDIAFSVGQQRIVLGEHQSTINPNMPLRCLMYIGREMEQIVSVKDRYKKSLVKIPTPEFYTFYNGKKEYPAEATLHLSDAFLEKTDAPSLELAVHVININQNKHHSLLNKCEVLREYSEFIEEVRKYPSDQNKLEQAVKECIKKGILSDYLSRKSAEVVNMLMAEYDYDTDIKVQREEAREEGREEGKAEGRAEGRAEGKAEGEAIGKSKGENLFAALAKKLLGMNATEELSKAASASTEEKQEYYKKYGITE